MASLFDRHRKKQRNQKPAKTGTNSFKADPDTPGLISKLSHDGRGVTRNTQGKTVFVRGALPGEQVTYKVHTTRSRFDEAVADQVLKAADSRVIPFCRHFSKCGGCQLQHMRYNSQIAFKQQTIAEQFKQHPGGLPFEAPLLIPEGSGIPGTGYRRKARLGVKWRKNGELHLGFREQNSHYVTPISDCAVLEPELEKLLAPLSQLLPTLQGKREIGHIELICGEPEHLGLPHVGVVVRLVKKLKKEDRTRWQRWAADNQVRVIADFGEQPEGAQFELIAPAAETTTLPCDSDDQFLFSYQIENKALYFRSDDFIQVNAALNRKMVAQALEWLDLKNTDSVLDLFSGFGNFTLPIADHVAHVTAIEGVSSQVERGSANARMNNLNNVTFVCADLNQPDTVLSEQSFNVVVLDPPRAGADAVVEALLNEAITNNSVEKVLYISCNPATLARDSERLMHAFSLKKVGLMDMFSHTGHVETMALFERAH